ncbi:MAG: response regulator, partial [Chloroflexota bacterium]
MPNLQWVTILLVEDDPGHARLIEKNLRRANLNNDLIVVTDGAQAVDYVFHQGAYQGRDQTQ